MVSLGSHKNNLKFCSFNKFGFDTPENGLYTVPMIQSIFTGLIDIAFPRNCMLCRTYHPATAHDPLCPRCRETLPLNKPPFCIRCSRHLNAVSEEGLCPSCRTRLPPFDEAWALLHYEGPVREILHRFKFHNKTAVRRTFAALLHAFTERYALQFPDAEMVIPIPLHPARLRERGYNQADLLAAGVAHEFQLPLRNDILIRVNHTPRQSALGAKDRWTNIKGAFRIQNLSAIVGRSVIVVDDILTTTATASEAAKTLKDAGASRVIIITLGIASCGSCVTTS
jgi:ComF family protein